MARFGMVLFPFAFSSSFLMELFPPPCTRETTLFLVPGGMPSMETMRPLYVLTRATYAFASLIRLAARHHAEGITPGEHASTHDVTSCRTERARSSREILSTVWCSTSHSRPSQSDIHSRHDVGPPQHSCSCTPQGPLMAHARRIRAAGARTHPSDDFLRRDHDPLRHSDRRRFWQSEQ